jgi:4-amino-4-deoxy-L-arabinose transferase-like glycosyltransferase
MILLKVGLQWDSFDFLADAYYFAGIGFGYVDFYRPPVLPFITSIPVRLGLDSEIVISIVDGVLFIMGVLGLYQLLKLRFSNINSFIGVLFYISFPVVLLWLGVGYTDLASLSLSIWAIYFMILALKQDSKFFILCWPILTLAFLTRFSAALFIFPILFYLLVNRNKIKIFEFIIGIILSFIIIIPYLIFITFALGDPTNVFLNFYNNSASISGLSGFAHNMDPTFYFKNALYSLVNLNLLEVSLLPLNLAFLIVTAGVLCTILMGLILSLNKLRILWSKIDFQIPKNRLILSIIFLIIFIITLGRLNYLISDFILLILILIIYDLVKGYKCSNLDLDVLWGMWIASFLIFLSFYPVKVIRYLIVITPAIAYFITMGWSQFHLRLKGRYLPSLSNLALILILLISITTFMYQLEYEPISRGDNFNIIASNHFFVFETTSQPTSGLLYQETYNTQDIKNTTLWLQSYDPNYQTKTIYADYFWPIFSWNLKKGVGGLTTRDKDLNTELINNNVDYYYAFRYYNLTNYGQVMEFKTNFGNIVLYKRF